MRLRTLVSMVLFLPIVFSAAPLFSSTNFAANANMMKPAPLVPPAQTILLGERLVYDVYWIGIHVGSGEVWVK